MTNGSSYGADYYECHLGPVPCRRGEAVWEQFVGHFAELIVERLRPASVLDAGCGIGLLVEALRDRGVEAWGLDVSEYAISQVPEALRPYCTVASISEPLERDYELIACIEVLEHLSEGEALRAIANLSAHTNSIVFSSTPDDFREPTHVNVQPPDYWVGAFAKHGFFRDVDLDLSTVAPHAMHLRRAGQAIELVASDYERAYSRLVRELAELRASQSRVSWRRLVSSLRRRVGL